MDSIVLCMSSFQLPDEIYSLLPLFNEGQVQNYSPLRSIKVNLSCWLWMREAKGKREEKDRGRGREAGLKGMVGSNGQTILVNIYIILSLNKPIILSWFIQVLSLDQSLDPILRSIGYRPFIKSNLDVIPIIQSYWNRLVTFGPSKREKKISRRKNKNQFSSTSVFRSQLSSGNISIGLRLDDGSHDVPSRTI